MSSRRSHAEVKELPMKFDAEAILEAEPQELPSLLTGVDLRAWLQTTMAHQLDYQASLAKGSFDPSHPALAMEQYARLRALGFLGPEAMPEILALLVHPQTAGSNPVVWSACESLVRMGPLGEEAAPALLQRLLRDGITEYPSRVVGALAAVATDRAAVVQSLTLALDAEEERTVLAALYALPALEARETLPRIQELSHSPQGEVRSQAALALGVFGDEGSRSRLLELTHDPEWYVRGNAIDSLGVMGGQDDEVRQAALRILTETDHTPDWSAPECAARTLRKLGGAEEAIRQRLLQPQVSGGLAEECIQALREAGVTGWEDQVREEFGYLMDGER